MTVEEGYAEFLNEIYPVVTIGEVTYDPDKIVRECDPIAWHEGVRNWADLIATDDEEAFRETYTDATDWLD